jgi:hypothetical protein
MVSVQRFTVARKRLLCHDDGGAIEPYGCMLLTFLVFRVMIEAIVSTALSFLLSVFHYCLMNQMCSAMLLLCTKPVKRKPECEHSTDAALYGIFLDVAVTSVAAHRGCYG